MGAWAEVERLVFERYLEMFKRDGRDEPPHPGRLANHLRSYDGSLGAPVMIQFQDATHRPTLSLTADDDSHLAREQREGIDNHRFHDLLAALRGR